MLQLYTLQIEGRSMAYEILGVGTPILDHVIQVSDEYLSSISGCKGGMEPVDYKTFRHIIDHCGSSAKLVAGGSCANTIKGLANLNHRCSMIGAIGQDESAKYFLNSLELLGIHSSLITVPLPTAQVACLITPDGQRTFRSFLGSSQEIKPHHLTVESFKGVRLVHIEGYTLLNESLPLKAMEIAKEVGAKVSFDLASFELAEAYRNEIIQLLSHHVDILFANEDEVYSLTHLDPKKGSRILSDLCEVVAVCTGPKGCWIGSNHRSTHYPAYPVQPLDTTGAGDLFAAGFLHGYLRGCSWEKCAHYGALTGAEVVQVLGAEIPQSVWDGLSKIITEDSEGAS